MLQVCLAPGQIRRAWTPDSPATAIAHTPLRKSPHASDFGGVYVTLSFAVGDGTLHSEELIYIEMHGDGATKKTMVALLGCCKMRYPASQWMHWSGVLLLL